MDIAYALHVPNSRIYTPFDEESLVRSLREALECDVPCFVRYPKAVLTQVELETMAALSMQALDKMSHWSLMALW